MEYIERKHPNLPFGRIFGRTKNVIMNNQHCKVGSITPITQTQHAFSLMEYQYQNFLEKASDLKYSDDKLAAFFELKARKLKKLLENFVQ
ncbi:hypothetical protein [Eudoraea chungangensis]|uniref:hypothetical protein n=1 Tax=Eudoraea chungangensis TaxID=1481905 RepID=UPI0023EA8D71|nr:hypothetical protein [Eudoraea chungangensis]